MPLPDEVPVDGRDADDVVRGMLHESLSITLRLSNGATDFMSLLGFRLIYSRILGVLPITTFIA